MVEDRKGGIVRGRKTFWGGEGGIPTFEKAISGGRKKRKAKLEQLMTSYSGGAKEARENDLSSQNMNREKPKTLTGLRSGERKGESPKGSRY